MTKKIFLLGFVSTMYWLVGCQRTAAPVQQAPEPVILTIGNKQITTDEFFQSFSKNQFSDDTTKKTSVEEYLNLYTNFRLKVMAAQAEGRDNTQAYKDELSTYRKVLAQQYLHDKILIDNMVAEAYQHLKEEIRLSHILVPVVADAAPADTLAAYRVALALRGRIQNDGEDFASIAQRYSKDEVSASKGGDLGYLVAFQTVYAIENAAYKLAKGQVSAPVRTQAGYHLLQVTERRPARGAIQVAHILVRVSPNATEAGQKAAQEKIESAAERLKQEAWEIVCREYSDDATSKQNNGVLPVFNTGENVPAFEEAAYKLQNAGDVSAPFLTTYGWHIVKLITKKPLPTFDEVSNSLRQKVMVNTRGDVVQAALAKKLRKTYKIEEASGMPKAIFEKIDTTLLNGTWKITDDLATFADKKPILSIDKKNVEAPEFLDFLTTRQKPRPAGTSLGMLLGSYYQQFIDKKLIETEEANLETKNAEFKSVITEIAEGVLLSEIMEKNVWEKSLTDSVAQRALYERTKDKYRYPERAWASVVSTDSDSLLSLARTALQQQPYQLKRRADELIFAPESAEITQKHREQAFEIALTMLRSENYIVEVSAYANDNEPDSMSAVRLRNTVKLLTNNRVPITRIMEKDLGKFKPLTDAKRNRRVSFQYFSTSKKDVEKALNALRLGTISIQEDVFAKGANPILNTANWSVGQQLVKHNGKRIIIDIARIEPSRIKAFGEARGAVINALQKQLETEWVEKLKQQFPITINETELKKLK